MKLPSILLAVAVLLGTSLAQDLPIATTTSSPSTSTSSAPATTHTVLVGQNGGGHAMSPNTTYAEVGDVVEWVFYPTNHSVVQGVYQQACLPVNLAYPGQMGFWSGNPYVAGLTDLPTFQVTINDTEPIFYYCGAPSSCSSNQMVGAINPNSTKQFTLANYANLASLAEKEYNPTDSWTPESDSSSTSPSGSSGPSGPSGPSSTTGHSSSSISAGAIAGIAIGAVAALLISGILLYFCGRRGGVEWAQKRYWPWGGAQSGPSVSTVGTGSEMMDGKGTLGFSSPPMSPGYPLNTPRIVSGEHGYVSSPYSPPSAPAWPTQPHHQQYPPNYPQQYAYGHQPTHSLPMYPHHHQPFPPAAPLPPSELASDVIPRDATPLPGPFHVPGYLGPPAEEQRLQTTTTSTGQGDGDGEVEDSPTIKSALPEYRSPGGASSFSFASDAERSYRPSGKN